MIILALVVQFARTKKFNPTIQIVLEQLQRGGIHVTFKRVAGVVARLGCPMP